MSANPTRRVVLAGAGAALAVPAAAAPPEASGSPDAALIALCADFVARERTGNALSAQADSMPQGPERDAVEARKDEVGADYHERLDEIVSMRAQTLAGARAKAEVVIGWCILDLDGEPAGEDAVAWSLAQDVLGLVGRAA